MSNYLMSIATIPVYDFTDLYLSVIYQVVNKDVECVTAVFLSVAVM